jgi:hypothetical protein
MTSIVAKRLDSLLHEMRINRTIRILKKKNFI